MDGNENILKKDTLRRSSLGHPVRKGKKCSKFRRVVEI